MKLGVWISAIVYLSGCFPTIKGVPSVSSTSDLPQSFILMSAYLPTVVFDIRYAGVNNFVGGKITGYEQPLCFLTQKTAVALKAVQEELDQKGYRLKIFDCYRPQRAVNHFVEWAKQPDDPKMKKQYYPNEEKSKLIEKGYIAEKSGHSRGSTVDLTLVQKSTSLELDMGTPFDYFDPRSATLTSSVQGQAKQNRLLLKNVMEKHGFENYAKEWWHYTLKDEPFKNRYFDVVISESLANQFSAQ